MGSINRGSFKNTKASTRSKVSNGAYNRNAASKYGNNKFGFKEAPKTYNSNIKISNEIEK